MRIVYMGTGDIGLPSLRSLLDAPEHEVVAVVTQPDKPAGRRLELVGSPIKLLAQERGLPILQPVRIREPGALEPLRALAPDVIVVMAYGQILPGELLRLPRLACLNLHASLLPRHRGAAPIQSAIVAGDRTSGLTVMYMDEGLDTGPMLLKRVIRVRRRETGGTLHARIGELGPDALRDALQQLAARTAQSIPQDAAFATHAPKLTREHGNLDWRLGAVELERRIRAYNPWPCAHTVLPLGDQPKVLKVFSAIVHRKDFGAPGTVLRADRRGLLVAAGEGSVLLREVQLEGKRRMSAGELLLGHPVAVGSAVGEPVTK
jgi:methionyl-tRNA formyltransferase